MRNIINISLPETMVKMVKKEVRRGYYASVSEFFRDLIRMWNTKKLAEKLEKSRKEFEAGKGTRLKSLKDLR